MVEYKYDALRIIGIALTTSSVTALGFGLYLYGIVVGQSIVLGGTT